MNAVTRLAIDPLLPTSALYGLIAAAALAWIAYAVLRGRAWLTRAGAMTLLGAALLNPSIVREEREPLPSVAAIVLDRSESMAFGGRSTAADAALSQLRGELSADPSLELRVVEAEGGPAGSQLFSALEGALADVSGDRIAGSIFITDGQVHDRPSGPASATGPVHALIVGGGDPGDRRVEIVSAPTFGIVGEKAAIEIRIDDPESDEAPLSLSLNGEPLADLVVPTGKTVEYEVELAQRGDNIVVVETPIGREELTPANNSASTSISGVRDRLRVLLITGRPNAAGRVWRDLLKSDPSVDLVHFTILRPPFKNDLTPIEELALIPFPTEELFEEKLGEFDLVIFDQYERRGVVTQSYLANMARYVEDGGALIIAAGEPFAGPASLARTPLASVLPAAPTGKVLTGRFRPVLTQDGLRHSVTQTLEDQALGPWMRFIEARAEAGDVLLAGPDEAPLLVVDRVGNGRVGQLLSDQIWLWARGHEGGGPFSELIRRMVHWMMREPELEERRLTLEADGETARLSLRTLAERPPQLTLEGPDGDERDVKWREDRPGQYSAEAPISDLGLYRARAGGLEAIALNGPANPLEYRDLRATGDVLQPLIEPAGGGVEAFSSGGGLPEIRRIGRRDQASGRGWFGLRERGAYVVQDQRSQPLLPGLAAALVAMALLMLAWRREGQ